MGEQETKQGKNLVVGDWIDFKLHSVYNFKIRFI